MTTSTVSKFKKFENVLIELLKLHMKKSADYGSSDDPYDNLRDFGWKGVVVRLGDKYHRLKNLIKSNKLPANESIEDTFKDIAVYAIIGYILFKEDNKKEGDNNVKEDKCKYCLRKIE